MTAAGAQWICRSSHPDQDKSGESGLVEEVMSLNQLVTWIVVGGIAGLLADVVVKRIRLGLISAIVVGILGGFIGGWLFDVLRIRVGGGFVSDVIVSFAGAVILLLVLRLFRRR
jgi:uncharacterized membrane protein YeaQ/YmgE (transglycosylase-associated protein family)